MSYEVVIVNYGMGNLNSIKRTMDRLRVNCAISSDARDIRESHRIILPGVGHFGQAMSNLSKLNLLDALNEAAFDAQKPILGICLGMQLMTKHSEEGNCDGLGWFDAELIKFNIIDRARYKVPHMGWNQISIKKYSKLMENIPDLAEFYFVHSYHLKVREQRDVLNDTQYEEIFPSAIENKNLFGVQYHPEKSHDVGLQLLKNFIEL